MTTDRVVPCLVLALCGCASLKSTPLSATSPIEGLTYFMPKQDLMLTVTVCDTVGKHQASFAMTPANPDLGQGYVLHHVGNGISKSTSTVGVGTNGLLTTTTTKVVSGVAEIATSIGEIAGTAGAQWRLGMMITPETPDSVVRCGAGTHVFRFDLLRPVTRVVCGVTVEVTRLAATSAVASAPSPTKERGLYYRQAEPYSVRVSDGGRLNVAGIVLSPSNAPVRFLPIRRSFAATNETDIDFTDGIPTSVTQDIDGEVVAVLKLPAVVVGSYFKAIGSIFDSFKTRDTNEAEVLAGAIKLDLAKKKYDACLVAIRNGDTAAQAALECAR